jgi:3-phenylpropionate/trans-cinnamate dioxygenase ferredoxin component
MTTENTGSWVAVSPPDRLADQAIVCVRVDSIELLLIRDGDQFFACERACPHEQADLSWGRISDGRLFCPRHLASFDLRDGTVSPGWSTRPLQRYPARIADGQIWIDAEAVRADAK